MKPAKHLWLSSGPFYLTCDNVSDITMEIVTLYPFMYLGKEMMLMRFNESDLLNGIAKRLPGVKWSVRYEAWYLPIDKESYRCILKNFQPVAKLNRELLDAYLLKKKAVEALKVPATVATEPAPRKTTAVSLPVPAAPKPSVTYNLCLQNLRYLQMTMERLALKCYSPGTLKTYRGELLVYFQVLGNIDADRLQIQDVKRYLLKCIREGKSENTMHSRINALKFFYEQVLGREKFFVDIPRPRKPVLLPRVLSEKEITRLFNALSNRKHKAILFTAYSAGLRVSEVVKLRLQDIDSRRMQIFIGRAKGKKDRYVNLSPVLLDILREYIRGAEPRPREYLFEGSGEPGCMYSVRSAQKVFQLARKRAEIRKDVSFHSLRHSFATHILEKGIDIRYIKDILGHFNIKTTERYLHVKKELLVNIVSPLDDIWNTGDLEW